jgi:hypothetical protein
MLLAGFGVVKTPRREGGSYVPPPSWETGYAVYSTTVISASTAIYREMSHPQRRPYNRQSTRSCCLSH